SQVRMGALVSMGTTLLNTISSTDPIAVDFPINERDVPRFNAMRQSDQILRDSIITISLPGNQLFPSPGRISAIDRAVDRNTGTITVRANFPNQQNTLLPGMNTTVHVRSQSDGAQLVIPYRAVSEQLGQTSVYVVTDSSTVEQRGVRLGTKVADRVVITDGLSKGETVVTDGIINLRPGSTVEVIRPTDND